MLTSLRRALSSWIVLGLLGVIMIAFIITGFGVGGGGLGDLGSAPEELASVNGQSVTAKELNAKLERALKDARVNRPDLDMPQFIRLGAFDELLQQAILDKAQIVFAQKNGLAVSKRMVDGVIAGEAAFLDATGKFDERTYRSALANAGVSESQLRDDLRTRLFRRQLLLPLIYGTRMPETIIRHYATLLLETRTGAVGAIPIKNVGPGKAPTEPEIAAYFSANKARYMIPERRVLRYALFGRADVAAAAKPTDAEIEAAYRQKAATYGPKETRAVAQIILPDRNAANAFATKVKGGKPFNQAAAEAGFAAADVVRAEGTKVEIGRKVAPAVANAAFAATQGAIVGPIQSEFGWTVLRVEKATTVPARPLTAVRGELAAEIEERKTSEALNALTARIEDAIGAGQSFNDVARTNGFQVVETQPVTASGAAPGTNYQLPVEARALLKPASDLEPDDDPTVETVAAGQRYALLAVGRVVDPVLPPLAQVREQVKNDIIQERSTKRARAIAEQVVAKINAGTPIREALAKAGASLPPVQSVTLRRIEANRAGDRVPPPVKQMFLMPKGKARMLPAPGGLGWFIVVVEDTRAGTAAEIQPLIGEISGGLNDYQRNEYAEQAVRAIEGTAKVKRNESAIAKLKQRLLSGGTAR